MSKPNYKYMQSMGTIPACSHCLSDCAEARDGKRTVRVNGAICFCFGEKR